MPDCILQKPVDITLFVHLYFPFQGNFYMYIGLTTLLSVQAAPLFYYFVVVVDVIIVALFLIY